MFVLRLCNENISVDLIIEPLRLSRKRMVDISLDLSDVASVDPEGFRMPEKLNKFAGTKRAQPSFPSVPSTPRSESQSSKSFLGGSRFRLSPKRREPAPKLPQSRQQPGMLLMESYMVNVVRIDLKMERNSYNQKRVHQKWEYEVMRSTSSLECQGDRAVRKMQAALKWVDKNMFPRSKQQMMMHHAMLILSFEQYYGEDIGAHLVRLLKKYKMSELRTEGLFVAPRRFGKTVCAAIYVSCETVVLAGVKGNPKGHDVLIYSNNQRASSLFLMHTYRITRALAEIPEFGGAVTHLNRKEKLIYMTSEGYQNEISAFPANEEKLRGTGATAYTSTVIGEEIGFVPVGIVMKILAPTLTRKRTKFIGITTMNMGDPFLKPLMEAKYPDGRSVMLTLDFDLVCDDCKKSGRALQCKCLAADIPHWQSAARHDKLSILMDSHKNTLLTEIKNVPIDERTSAAFSRTAVEWLRTEEAIIRQSEFFADHIFTTVDPAAGGQHSLFAIVSVVWRENMLIVSFFCWFLFFSVAKQIRDSRDVLFWCHCVSRWFQMAKQNHQPLHLVSIQRLVVWQSCHTTWRSGFDKSQHGLQRSRSEDTCKEQCPRGDDVFTKGNWLTTNKAHELAIYGKFPPLRDRFGVQIDQLSFILVGQFTRPGGTRDARDEHRVVAVGQESFENHCTLIHIIGESLGCTSKKNLKRNGRKLVSKRTVNCVSCLFRHNFIE